MGSVSGEPPNAEAPKGWIDVRAAARRAHVSHWKMLRRLRRLHESAGGGIIESYQPPGRKPRKYWVNPDALRLAVDGRAPELERRLEEALSRLALVEKKVNRLRDSHNALKRKAKTFAAT